MCKVRRGLVVREFNIAGVGVVLESFENVCGYRFRRGVREDGGMMTVVVDEGMGEELVLRFDVAEVVEAGEGMGLAFEGVCERFGAYVRGELEEVVVCG